MKPTDSAWIAGLRRPWDEVASAVARDRARRFREQGAAAFAAALAAAEQSLRAAPGWARQRELDLEHHVRWRQQLDRIARHRSR